MRRRLATAMLGVLVSACSADREVSIDETVPDAIDRVDAADPRAELDRRWDEYEAHRARMSTGDLVSTPSRACGAESDCPLGFDVDGWYYVLSATPLDAGAVGKSFVSLPDGSTAHAVVGAEPAIYLARVEGDRRELMIASTPPVATTRERTLELRADRCSIVGLIESIVGAIEFSREPRGCDDPAVRWLVGFDPGRWEVDDPSGTSDPRIWRTEPVDPAAGEVSGPNGALLGPFDDPIARLDVALDRQCSRFAAGQCRVGYAIDEQSTERVAATFVRQNVAEGSDVAYETTSVHTVLEILTDGRWWSTESGPSAIHQNGVGLSGFDDAETRFDGCCDAVAGSLIAP